MGKCFWRVGVGVGEASLFPAGFALLADYFPPKRLGRAIACFTMSSMLGTAIAYIFVGALIEMLRTLGAQSPTGEIHGCAGGSGLSSGRERRG